VFGKKEGRVPLNGDVLNKCMCDTCPVQAQSACAKPKIQNMVKMRAMSGPLSESGRMSADMNMSMAQTPMKEMNMNPDEIAGPYCATGVASCMDLDMNKSCICPSCSVYSEYNLKNARPMEHFCFNDKAV
jgi:Protein of unknown function (DUF2769)